MTQNNTIKTKIFNDFYNFLKKQPKGLMYSNASQEEVLKEKTNILSALKKRCKNCQECPLAKQGRTQVVFGVGNPNASIMFVGEAPGRDEDIQGMPFIGRAGKLLTKIIEAMGLSRDDVYITNVVKSRPPNNRTPTIEEREVCKGLILFKEIETIQPKIICTLGAPSTQAFLGDDVKISRVRGTFVDFGNFFVMPTFHPAYLLRNPVEKKKVWEDMKKIMSKIEAL
jgi:uracil-DNA glycosylase